jgi:hypothetical protein
VTIPRIQRFSSRAQIDLAPTEHAEVEPHAPLLVRFLEHLVVHPQLEAIEIELFVVGAVRRPLQRPDRAEKGVSSPAHDRLLGDG